MAEILTALGPRGLTSRWLLEGRGFSSCRDIRSQDALDALAGFLEMLNDPTAQTNAADFLSAVSVLPLQPGLDCATAGPRSETASESPRELRLT